MARLWTIDEASATLYTATAVYKYLQNAAEKTQILIVKEACGIEACLLSSSRDPLSLILRCDTSLCEYL